MAIQLSICIPTYNREKYLKQLLDCIEKQLQDIEKNIVEICVSDNSSTDNTQQVIQQYQQKYNNITYFRWDKNMGADMNFLKVVEIAHGKYCWFFGSDDLMLDGAIKKMLEEIKENCDIYLVNSIQYDIKVTTILSKYTILKKNIATRIFKFNNDNDILDYFKSINMLVGCPFSYLSSSIFKKEQWNSIEFDKSFIGTAYAHTYILLSLLKEKIKLKYINNPIIIYRAGNDSFACDGIVKRIKIDYDGYRKLFTYIFKDYEKLAKYYKIFLRKIYAYSFLSTIYNKSNKDDRKILISFTKETHNSLIIYILSYFSYIYKKFFKDFFIKMKIHDLFKKVLYK